MFDHLWDCLALRKLSPLIFWEGVEGARRKQSRTAREYCAERHFQVYLTYPYCMTPISLLFIAVQVENFRSQRGELISPLVIIDSHNVHIRSAFRNQKCICHAASFRGSIFKNKICFVARDLRPSPNSNSVIMVSNKITIVEPK